VLLTNATADRLRPDRRLLVGLPVVGRARAVTWLSLVIAAFVATAPSAAARIETPEIRMTPTNQVPACVTPDRLMAFLRTRNAKPLPRFQNIAYWYRKHGEIWRVRWDYAFFQMALETNFLTYRQPNGRWGDVNPKQNNFAGLGTTGGGVPGDSYPDVSTGVLAQIQHLVAYSGERLASPVGPRTRLKQDIIVELSEKVTARRPMTFQDLSGRWAVDKRYGRSINGVASEFANRYCRGGLRALLAPANPRRQRVANGGTTDPFTQAARMAPRSVPKPQPVSPPPAPATVSIETCAVSIASFGGSETVLIGALKGTHLDLTALDVKPGQADAMTRGFIAQYAPGGTPIARYRSRQAALEEAYRRCPAASQPLNQG
jgi:hypothetical protein